MLLPGVSPKTWLLLTVLVSTFIAYCESGGAKTLDINIGFDLTQRKNGSSSLHIQDHRDPETEFNRRAVDDNSSSDSSSNRKSDAKKSAESAPKKSESSKENAPQKSSGGESGSNDDSSSSEKDNKRSTRGMKADELEPEDDNPRIHEKYHFSGSDRSNRS